jgi:predicted metal-binding protein
MIFHEADKFRAHRLIAHSMRDDIHSALYQGFCIREVVDVRRHAQTELVCFFDCSAIYFRQHLNSQGAMEIVNPHLDQVWFASCHFVNRPNCLLWGCDSVQLALRQTERWRSAIWNPNSAVRTEQIGARQNTLKHQGTRIVNFEQVGPNGALLSFCGVSAALFARL